MKITSKFSEVWWNEFYISGYAGVSGLSNRKVNLESSTLPCLMILYVLGNTHKLPNPHLFHFLTPACIFLSFPSFPKGCHIFSSVISSWPRASCPCISTCKKWYLTIWSPFQMSFLHWNRNSHLQIHLWLGTDMWLNLANQKCPWETLSVKRATWEVAIRRGNLLAAVGRGSAWFLKDTRIWVPSFLALIGSEMESTKEAALFHIPPKKHLILLIKQWANVFFQLGTLAVYLF